MTRVLFLISRILVGATFIFAGFVKAVDPMGYAIKITDYLSAFHLEGLSSMAMIASIAIIALEFLTGLHLLLGIRIKTASFFTLVFMAVFTPLTLYIAIAEPVTDCGCFGDALKISNWQTFIKNVIICLPTVWLYLNRKNFNEEVSAVNKVLITAFFTLGIIGVSQYSLKHLPVLDFRPYKVGSNIHEGMIIPEDAEQPEYETTFLMEKGGEQKTFTAENYPYTDSTWVFVSSKTKVLKKGYEPPIHDFVLMDAEGVDQTQNIINNDNPILLVVSSQIKKGTWSEGKQEQIKALKDAIYEQGVKTYFLTASADDDITKFEFEGDGGFEYLNADETMLKTIIRSNPGLVLLQKGNVVGKWHHNDIPQVAEFKNPVRYSLGEHEQKQNKMFVWLAVLTSLLVVIVLMRKNK
ncbi:BT_3928 family protein [Labilibacter marinus]|uniref:BT_3928 family protein n=1 Tax=Labilibacter marinus TaxID=1477105 RepID=UPI00083545E1|nr:BT_3928 family protein [Labilibacter marinus]